MKHSLNLLIYLGLLPLAAAQAQLAPDQAGCVDSRVLPKLDECRIDNCDKRDSDRREVPVGEEKGDAVTASIEGDSRSMMYECRDGMTAASIVQQAAAALKTAGFEIPYKFTDSEATLTARKDELWVLVDAAAHYYTLIELKGALPDFESVGDAAAMADAIMRYGHVPLYGVHFLLGRPEMNPESVIVLEEVVVLLEEHPEWRLRIEDHTDNTGSQMANMILSSKRAAVVAAWLIAKGVKRTRLDPQGMGQAHPVADNATEAGKLKNRRIELVKTATQP